MINKKYLFIGLIIGFGLVIIIFSLANNRDKNIEVPVENQTPTPTPTLRISLFPTKTNNESLDPNVIFPTLPPKQQVEVDAIRNLRNKSPFSQENFTINYDYHLNKFNIIFAGGKNASKTSQFKKWLKNSEYGAISLDYFNFP